MIAFIAPDRPIRARCRTCDARLIADAGAINTPTTVRLSCPVAPSHAGALVWYVPIPRRDLDA